MNKTIRLIIKFILAYGTTIAIAGVSGYGITGIEIILPAIFALAMVVYLQADSRMNKGLASDKNIADRTKKDLRWASVVGVIFDIAVTVGAHYDVWNEEITPMGIRDIFYLIMLGIFFSATVFLLFDYLSRRDDHDGGDGSGRDDDNDSNKPGRKLPFLMILCVLMICWLPYYLTMLPGNLGKDTFESIDMCLGRIPWTNHHPIFFTLLIDIVLGITSWTGSITAGMAVFTLLHQIAYGCTIAYLIRWIFDRCGMRMHLIALIFFALHPVVAMYSIYISKDVLFSCALIMFVLSLYDMIARDGRNFTSTTSECIWMGVWACFTCLLRNNGLMIMMGMLIILLLMYRRQWKRVLATLGVPIVIFMLFRACAYNILGVEKESFAESMSIPLQQVGYVITCSDGDSIEGVSEEDVAFLNNMMSLDEVREVFELGYTDAYKFAPGFDDEYLNEHSGEFLAVWMRMLPGHFGEYVDSYLAQTLGYWHYGETNTLCTQGIWEDNTVGVTRVDVIDGLIGRSLYGIIEKLMLGMRKAPLLCILTSMAMQFYAVLLLIARYARTGDRRIIAMMPMILLWASIMVASPAFCLFRYTYPMFMLWPLMAGEILGK